MASSIQSVPQQQIPVVQEHVRYTVVPPPVPAPAHASHLILRPIRREFQDTKATMLDCPGRVLGGESLTKGSRIRSSIDDDRLSA
jgi:hypothetical protein